MKNTIYFIFLIVFAFSYQSIIASVGDVQTPNGSNVPHSHKYLEQQPTCDTDYITDDYPNNVIVGSCDVNQNCNAYAFAGQGNLWITDPSIYWQDGSYVSCAESVAEIAVWNGGAHSAVKVSSNRYVSKWGPGPLVEHYLNDTPYGSSIVFYRRNVPKASVSTTSINLGSHSPGTSFSSNFQISNSGVNTLSGTVSESASWITSLSPSSFSGIGAGSSVTVNFSGNFPSNAGSFSTTITINTNGGNKTVQVTGTVPGTPLSVTILGPSYLGYKEPGQYNASVSGGTGVYSYQWYFRQPAGSGYWGNPVSTSSTYNRTMNVQDFELKLTVSSGGYVQDAYKTVYYGLLSKKNNEDNLANVENTFSLAQNYPNPFNPVSLIQYNISKASFVNIKVYDALGKEVAELVNRSQGAGSYSVEFNGSNLPSGIYFYRITAGNFSETKKMILAK